MKIGIFDSGVGGKTFIESVKKAFPDAEIIYKDDKKNLPYGNKTISELLTITLPIFHLFEEEGCSAVLVACNTVTTTIIKDLREKIGIPLVGVEPMVKPAALLTQTGIIAVCATPATLKSARYSWLKQTYAPNVAVEEPDCSNWADMIEQNRQNELKIDDMIQGFRSKHVDVVVLGCTHYHWIEKEIRESCGRDIQVIQPTAPVILQLQRVLTAD